jgi:hypothetical protein
MFEEPHHRRPGVILELQDRSIATQNERLPALRLDRSAVLKVEIMDTVKFPSAKCHFRILDL